MLVTWSCCPLSCLRVLFFSCLLHVRILRSPVNNKQSKITTALKACQGLHDLGPGTFESHWLFLGYCDGVPGGLGKTRRKARGGLIPSAPFTFPWSCWPSSCSSLAPLELHQTSSKRDLPRGPCTLQALGGSLWDFYTPLVLHGREKKWPAWLYRIRRPTFILRMVAHLRASAAPGLCRS